MFATYCGLSQGMSTTDGRPFSRLCLRDFRACLMLGIRDYELKLTKTFEDELLSIILFYFMPNLTTIRHFEDDGSFEIVSSWHDVGLIAISCL